MSGEAITFNIFRAQGTSLSPAEDLVVREVPLTIFYNEEEIITLLCSPSQLEELALGFLLTEGFITSLTDITDVYFEEENNNIWINGITGLKPKQLMNKRMWSSCCGKSRASFYFYNDARLVKRQESTLRITLDESYKYANYLQSHLPLFRNTGGIHSGGIGRNGEILFTSYDIGRHNVFDKLFGTALRSGVNLKDHIVFFSGRISSEILLKVAKMNIPILIARSAPTDLALNLAHELGITVIGFARENRLNIYTGPERVSL